MIQQHKPDTALHNHNQQRITRAAYGKQLDSLRSCSNLFQERLVYSQLNFEAGYQLALHYTEAAAAG